MQRRTVVAAVFYVGLSALMAAILFDVLADLIPAGIAARIGYNSEGYTAALVLAGWIQFARPRLHDRRWQWVVTVAVGLGFLVAGWLLYNSHLPSRFKTLNEAMVALGVLVPYVQSRRRPDPRLAVGVGVAILAAIVALNHTRDITLLAETYGLFVLLPIGLDAVDRGILDPRQVTFPRVRAGWYAALVALPIASSLLYHGRVLGGVAGEWIRYEVRLHESFVCMLLLQLYFAVGLGRTGRSATAARTARQTGQSTVAAG